MVTYEQPLNENMRLFLRLEYLFNNVSEHLEQDNQQSSQLALFHLLKILNVADRPDLKSKLNQTLTQQANLLKQMQQSPQVDSARLQKILQQLDQQIDNVHHTHGKIGEDLRKNDFLNQVRLQLGNPAGACDFAVPALMLWLNKPVQQRTQDLTRWFSTFDTLRDPITHIMQLTRNSGTPQTVQCQEGFYQQSLDPSLPNQLIRVSIQPQDNVFPEFSVGGKHRFSIRFQIPSYDEAGHATPLKSAFTFQLTCCQL